MKFECPHCGHGLRAPDTMAGKMGTCPRCKRSVLVPLPVPPPWPEAVDTPERAAPKPAEVAPFPQPSPESEQHSTSEKDRPEPASDQDHHSAKPSITSVAFELERLFCAWDLHGARAVLAEPLPNGLCQDVVSEFTERLKRCSQVDERLNRAQDWIGRALFENARKILLALDFPFREPGANDKYARIASMIPDTGFSEGGLQRDFSPHGRVEWLIERHRHDEARSLLQSHLKLNPADGVAESTLHWIEAALEDRHRLEFAESAILANDLAGAGAALLKVQIRSEFVDTMRRSLSKEIDSRAGGDSWAERVTDPRETQASNGSPDVPQQAPLDAGESFEPYRVLLDGLERLRDEVQNGDNRLAARIMASAEAEASLSQQLEEAKAIETRFAENEARALAKAEALESQLAAATDLEENLTVLCEGLRQAESALQSMMSQLAIQIEGFRQVLVASARIVAERASNSMASADPGATRSTREDIHMDRSTFGESDAPSPPQSVHGGMDFPDDLDVVKPIRIRRTQIID